MPSVGVKQQWQFVALRRGTDLKSEEVFSCSVGLKCKTVPQYRASESTVEMDRYILSLIIHFLADSLVKCRVIEEDLQGFALSSLWYTFSQAAGIFVTNYICEGDGLVVYFTVTRNTLKMEARSASETHPNVYQTIRRNIPEKSHLYTRCLENLKSYIFVCT